MQDYLYNSKKSVVQSRGEGREGNKKRLPVIIIEQAKRVICFDIVDVNNYRILFVDNF